MFIKKKFITQLFSNFMKNQPSKILYNKSQLKAQKPHQLEHIQYQWTRISSIKITIFDLKMMVKSGLEFFISKFTEPLQRQLLSCQANSTILGRYFCTGPCRRPYRMSSSWCGFKCSINHQDVKNQARSCVRCHMNKKDGVENYNFIHDDSLSFSIASSS